MFVCAPGFWNARWGQVDSAQLRMSAGQGLNRTRARRRASRGHINIARGICHRAAPSPAERPSRCAGRPIWPGANAHGRSCRALQGVPMVLPKALPRRNLLRWLPELAPEFSRGSESRAPSPQRPPLLRGGWGSGVLLDRLETSSVNTMLRNLRCSQVPSVHPGRVQGAAPRLAAPAPVPPRMPSPWLGAAAIGWQPMRPQ